jgi:transketolase
MNSIAFAQQIRKLSLEMVFRAKASHIGSALSIADILAVLYHQYLKVLPYDPRNKDRDILILSKGHACVALYAALAIKNYFDINLLKTYGENDSNFMNHISHKVDGVEFSTGSLGHGLSFGLGKALASKIKKVKKKVVVIIGDGELDEGSNWEALLFAAHHHINNLLLIVTKVLIL